MERSTSTAPKHQARLLQAAVENGAGSLSSGPFAAVGVARPPIAATGRCQRHRFVIHHRRARAAELVVASEKPPSSRRQVTASVPRASEAVVSTAVADRRLQRGDDRVGAAEGGGQYRDRPACGPRRARPRRDRCPCPLRSGGGAIRRTTTPKRDDSDRPSKFASSAGTSRSTTLTSQTQAFRSAAACLPRRWYFPRCRTDGRAPGKPRRFCEARHRRARCRGG